MDVLREPDAVFHDGTQRNYLAEILSSRNYVWIQLTANTFPWIHAILPENFLKLTQLVNLLTSVSVKLQYVDIFERFSLTTYLF